MILSSLGPESCIWIRGVLHHGGIHSAICFFSEPTRTVFNDGLFREASDQKLVFSDAVKILTALVHQLIGVIKDFLDLFSSLSAVAVVEALIVILRVIIMLKSLNQVIMFVLMKVDDQFGNTGIQQFSTAQVSDICLDHHGIHPSYPWTDSHHPGNLFSEVRDTVMKEIDVMKRFVIVTALTES